MPSDEALTAISRVDVLITIATTAALRGYHRSDMAATPDWASQLLRHIHTAPDRSPRHSVDRGAPDSSIFRKL